jgi:hypothetical protein
MKPSRALRLAGAPEEEVVCRAGERGAAVA